MSNSSLASYTLISPNSTNPRNHKIDTITIHHIAGVLSAREIANLPNFREPKYESSCNYAIGNDGEIALIVEEKNRSWCTGSKSNDHRAITIEVSNSFKGEPWPVSDAAMASLINLCVDICKRNGISKLDYTGDKTGNLTMHKWFQATGCPGQYLSERFPWIAEQVNNRLEEVPEAERWYRIRKTWEDAASQIGAYKDLRNAKAACLPGYFVFDWDGVCVYGNEKDEGHSLEDFIRDIQKACGAVVDGIAGSETLSKTVTISQRINNRHAVVKPLQKRLHALGYTTVGEADGIAGVLFTSAVMDYQAENGCWVDGEITARNKTWRKLLGME